MPRSKLVYSPLAQRDLDGIHDYIALELENPSAAAETVEDILAAAESLEEFPLMGSLVNELPFVSDEYRFLPVRNYLVFYRTAADRVFIDRILYKRRDYLPLLGPQ